MSGPLGGIRIVELASIGPVPHGTMLMADMGADVVRLERRGAGRHVDDDTTDWLLRGRKSIALDLRNPDDLSLALELVDQADVLVEGNRPGVTERLGIGPDVCLERNPRLVYARMTGWGQSGPRALQAGHDINYLSLTGALNAIGPASEVPPPPLNIIADVAGGSLMLVNGVLAALVERATTGLGQVVDVAMVDGVNAAMQMIWALRGQGYWSDARERNILDGANPCYRSYRCADDRFVAVGAIEPQFYALLLAGLGLNENDVPDRNNPRNWPALTEQLAGLFAQRTRDEWAEHFAESDACVTPVLTFAEAANDEHMVARGNLITLGGVVQGAPAPRFSRHPNPAITEPPTIDADREQILAEWLGRT